VIPEDPSLPFPETPPFAEAEQVSTLIASAMTRVGELLFVGGALVGNDRVAERSRWGYGDDRVVGLAVVAEVGADLAASALTLLRAGHRYAAMALLRQIVETEYLTWAFAHDTEEARRWPNADDDELRNFFSPRELRRRSQGAFRVEEYRSHCAVGGHPSPKSRSLLSSHSAAVPVDWLWTDLAMHLSRLWPLLMDAVDNVGMSSVVADVQVLVASNLGTLSGEWDADLPWPTPEGE